MLKVFYLENSMWEFDFITKDLLQNIETEVIFYNNDNIYKILQIPDIIENNVLIVSCIFIEFNKLLEIVKAIKPIVIFILSDENGNCDFMSVLSKYAKVVFRQYNHSSYPYSSNNHQMPLGYVKGFLTEKNRNSKRKLINERDTNACFIGDVKSDRMHMYNVFTKNMKNTKILFVTNKWDIDKLHYTPEQCFELYSNSIFVVIGRGNVNLDCFRIYEAMAAGSIPVIVGSMDEINRTFYYNNNKPPAIYAETWEDALINCNILLNDIETLQKIQDSILTWWIDQIAFINKTIIQCIQ